MSGSSGGGGGGDDRWREDAKPATKPKPKEKDQGGGDGAPPPPPCDITESATLNSPNRGVIASLRVRDLLDIVFEPGPPQRLLAKTQAGDTAGSITSPSMAQIIRCIQSGYSYVAEVVSVQGAICQVIIRPK